MTTNKLQNTVRARARIRIHVYVCMIVLWPSPSASALCSFRPRGRQSVAAAAQRPYVLMFFCSYVSCVSGFQSPLRRQPLCFLRPPGRQSVAVRHAAALYVSYVAYVLMFLCSRAKRLTQTLHLMFFCPSALLFPALAAAKPRHGASPSVLRVSGLSPNS